MPAGSTEGCVVLGPKLCKAGPAADSLEFWNKEKIQIKDKQGVTENI